MPAEPVLTMSEIAVGLGVSTETVRSWRKSAWTKRNAAFPRSIDGRGLYFTAAVVAWCREVGREFPVEWEAPGSGDAAKRVPRKA